MLTNFAAEALSGYPWPRHDVHEALYELLSDIQLTPEEIRRASDCHNEVRARLKGTLRGIKDDYLSGSYGRRTAITPLHDIDVIIVLDRDVRAALWRGAPVDTLRAMQAALRDSFPNSELTPQKRSVRIRYRQLDVDLVPAFESEREGVLEIPDRRASSWLLTDPDAVIDESPRLNQMNANLLKPIVKILKKWRDIWDIRLSSFHLEMMIYSLGQFQRLEIDHALTETFAHLHRAVNGICPDPANPHIDLGDYLSPTERADVTRRLAAAFGQAIEALRLAESGNLVEAHNHWKNVFRDAYPRQYWRRE
ncbi:MAG: hypothetical protein U1A78_33095 [Polyangia bacterium]